MRRRDEKQQSGSKRTVLMSAFACDIDEPGEPYVGFTWAIEMSRHFEVHLLTRATVTIATRTSLEAAGVRLHCFDLPGGARIDHRHRLIKLYYILWQLAALLPAWRTCNRYRVDLTHHVTYNIYELPGLMWLIPGPSHVLGPLGGGQVPPSHLVVQGYGRKAFSEVLRTCRKKLTRVNPLLRGAVRRAVIVAANTETAVLLDSLRPARSRRGDLSQVFPETAAPQQSEPPRGLRHRNRDLLWIGRLEARKGLRLLLASLEHLRTQPHPPMVAVLGDGPERVWLAEEIDKRELHHVIRLLGPQPYQKVQSHLAEARGLIFTSLQDTSGNVVLEALAKGTPVVALDHQGPRQLLQYGGGLLISPDNPFDQVARQIAAAVMRVVSDDDCWTELSSAAQSNVDTYNNWHARRRQMERVYDLAFE